MVHKPSKIEIASGWNEGDARMLTEEALDGLTHARVEMDGVKNAQLWSLLGKPEESRTDPLETLPEGLASVTGHENPSAAGSLEDVGPEGGGNPATLGHRPRRPSLRPLPLANAEKGINAGVAGHRDAVRRGSLA